MKNQLEWLSLKGFYATLVLICIVPIQPVISMYKTKRKHDYHPSASRQSPAAKLQKKEDSRDQLQPKASNQEKITFLPLSCSTVDLVEHGERYYFGQQGKKDFGRAWDCFKRAKKREDNPWAVACARMYLGQMYYLGQGRPRNLGKAYKYFSKVELQNDNVLAKAKAYIYKGQIHYLWEHYGQARQYFRLALSMKFSVFLDPKQYNPLLISASVLLGRLYYHGHGVEQDYGRAYELFYPALNQCYDSWAQIFAWAYVGVMYLNGYGVEKNEQLGSAYLKKVEEQDINQEAKSFVRKNQPIHIT